MIDYLRIGTIMSTHGLKGEVKLFPTTDDPQHLRNVKEVWLVSEDGKNQAGTALTIRSVAFFKQFVIMAFNGYDRIEDVMPLLKKDLYVSRDQAVPLEEGEYYIGDLIGLNVVQEDGSLLGQLSDVIRTGANDVYIIKGEKGELLIPAIRSCILNVDLKEQTMTVHLLKGMDWTK